MIMSKEAVEKRRSQIRRNRMVEEPPVLSPQQEAVIQELFNAHEKTFDITFSHFQFRVCVCASVHLCPVLHIGWMISD